VTLLSLFQFEVAHTLQYKGSIYGEASITPSPHSFQQHTGSNKPVYADRIKVLSNETIAFPWSTYSIIKVYDQERN